MCQAVQQALAAAAAGGDGETRSNAGPPCHIGSQWPMASKISRSCCSVQGQGGMSSVPVCGVRSSGKQPACFTLNASSMVQPSAGAPNRGWPSGPGCGCGCYSSTVCVAAARSQENGMHVRRAAARGGGRACSSALWSPFSAIHRSDRKPRALRGTGIVQEECRAKCFPMQLEAEEILVSATFRMCL